MFQDKFSVPDQVKKKRFDIHGRMIREFLRVVTLLLLLPLLTLASPKVAAEKLQFQSDTTLLTVYRDNDSEVQECGVVEKRSTLNVTSTAEVSSTLIPVSEEFITSVTGFCDKSYPFRHKYVRLKRELIFPGTKWCGMGNTAFGSNDLGALVATDTCCRAHDQCDVSIGPKEVKGGLQNGDIFSKVSCQCDVEFRDCLKRAEQQGERDAGTIGILYFDVLKQRCIVKETSPAVCEKWWHDKCIHQIPDPKKEATFKLVESHLKY